MAGYILYEGVKRLIEPPQVQTLGMLVIATLGLVVNLIAMRLLNAGKDSSLNVKGCLSRSLERFARLYWLTSDSPSLSAHLVVAANADAGSIRNQAAAMLVQRFHIAHVTLQIEDEDCRANAKSGATH